MELFDVMKCMFSREYYKVTNEDKVKNFFMVRRMLCGAFPYQTSMLNINGIDPIMGMDVLATLTAKYDKVPYWLFGKKGASAIKPTKEKKIFDCTKYDSATLQEVMSSLRIDMKDLKALYEAAPNETQKLISFIDSIVNEKNNIQIEYTKSKD